MKKLLCCICLFALHAQNSFAQSPGALHEAARNYIAQKDYANAILVLNRALQQSPGNAEMSLDLSQAYYFAGSNSKALEVIVPLLDNVNADDRSFQVAGMIYKQAEQPKEAEKAYKKGLKRFPASGPLYNELGEIEFAQQDYNNAIKNWEKGIETDPSYSRNYFNAARYYFLTTDKIWSVLYGEIFINMEPRGSKTTEMKQVLLDSYKKLFSDVNFAKQKTSDNNFVRSYLDIMNKESNAIAAGVNVESLTKLRARFITEWFAVPGRPAFRLFEHQQQLMNAGMFDAYNEWLFGEADNAAKYNAWQKGHAKELMSFNAFQNSKMFKVPAMQYYGE